MCVCGCVCACERILSSLDMFSSEKSQIILVNWKSYVKKSWSRSELQMFDYKLTSSCMLLPVIIEEWKDQRSFITVGDHEVPMKNSVLLASYWSNINSSVYLSLYRVICFRASYSVSPADGHFFSCQEIGNQCQNPKEGINLSKEIAYFGANFLISWWMSRKGCTKGILGKTCLQGEEGVNFK